MASKKVEAITISRETIKPSSRTPHHLKHHKQSLLDQLAMQLYIPVMLLYESIDNLSSNISHRLKNSLSETLTRYYPFAGRLANDGLSIDCNDRGVVFVEAHIKCKLHDFLEKRDQETQSLLFPEGFLWKDKSSEDCSLLAVQASFFSCGGVAICMSSSHKIADGSTISTFLQDWSNATTSRDHSRDPPIFLANSTPHMNLPVAQAEIQLDQMSCVTKRYVFNGSKLAALKKSLSMEAATRVEVVTALLYKCAIAFSSRKSLLIQLVNMRSRVSPSVPENSIGNFTWYHTVSPVNASMNEFVVQLQNGKRDFFDKNQSVNDLIMEIFESTKEVKMLFDDLNVYRCSSFCRWPFYQLDFGWGKPIWVNMADLPVKNMFVLFDTRDGDGIEALVSFEEEDMKVFKECEELLTFADLVPVQSSLDCTDRLNQDPRPTFSS